MIDGLDSRASYWTASRGMDRACLQTCDPCSCQCSLRSSEGLRPFQEGLPDTGPSSVWICRDGRIHLGFGTQRQSNRAKSVINHCRNPDEGPQYFSS